jgi:hypothetical protein
MTDKYNSKTEHKALNRPEPKIKTPLAKFSEAELSQSVWGKIALFLDHNYKKFTPFYHKDDQEQKKQVKIAEIQREAINNLRNNPDLDWQELIEKQKQENQESVKTFYYFLSRKFHHSPRKIKEIWHQNLQKFVQLLEYVLIDQHKQQDLLKIAELGKIFEQFNNSSAKTFFVLYQLPLYLESKDGEIIKNSFGYQTIIEAGNTRFIKYFGLELQKHFHITQIAIHEQVSENLVQHLGETEATLRNQVEILQQDNQLLKNEIEVIKTKAFQEATFQLGKTLQNQSQPVLNQILTLKQRLDQTLAENHPLSNNDALTCLITLEDIIKAFHCLNLIPFPDNIHANFTITGEQLGEYNYISGSPFNNNQDCKQVRCLRQGWRIGEQIITPAQVEEINQ